MNRVVEYVSLFLWSVYLIIAIYREVKSENLNLKTFWKKPFHFIRIDSLLFLVIYLIYNNFARVEVLPYVYLVMIIASIVYLLYDLFDNYKMTKVKKAEFIYFFLGLLLIILIFTYLIIGDDSINLLIITLVINLLIPLFISFVKLIKKH